MKGVVALLVMLLVFGLLPAQKPGFVGRIETIRDNEYKAELLALAARRDGIVYCATDKGLFVYDGNRSVRLKAEQFENNKEVTGLSLVGDSLLYFTDGSGLRMYSYGRVENVIRNATIRAVSRPDRSGRVTAISENMLFWVNGGKVVTKSVFNEAHKCHKIVIDNFNGVYAISGDVVYYMAGNKRMEIAGFGMDAHVLNDSVVAIRRFKSFSYYLRGKLLNNYQPRKNVLIFSGTQLFDLFGHDYEITLPEKYIRFPYHTDPVDIQDYEIIVPTVHGLLRVKYKPTSLRLYSDLFKKNQYIIAADYSNGSLYTMDKDYHIYRDDKLYTTQLGDFFKQNRYLSLGPYSFLNVGYDSFVTFIYPFCFVSFSKRIINITKICPAVNPKGLVKVFKSETGDILFFSVRDLVIYNPRSGRSRQVMFSEDIFVNDIAEEDGLLYIAAERGLYTINDKGIAAVSAYVGRNVLNVVFHKGEVFLNIRELGLIRAKKGMASAKLILDYSYRQGERYEVLAFGKDRLFLLSLGLLVTYDPVKSSFTYLDINEYHIEQIYGAIQDDMALHVYTDAGVLTINLGNDNGFQYNNEISFRPLAEVINVTAGTQVLSYRAGQILTLPYNAQRIELDLLTPIQVGFAGVRVYWNLDDSSGGWRLLQPDGKLILDNLSLGRHQLYIRFQKINGQNIIIPLLTWNVDPPFYYSQLAFIIYFLLFLLTTVIVIKLVRRRLMKRYELKNKMLRLSLQGLRTQLDPHFISNFLHNLQFSLLRKEKKEAVEALNEYVSLLRLNFEQMGREWILLADELTFLSTYVNFQRKEDDRPVEFEIEREGINLDEAPVYIPTMILQPLIENVFEHGRSLDGKVKIRMKLTLAKSLEVVLEDKGPGFSWPKDSEESGSLNVIQQRLNVFSQLFHEHYELISAPEPLLNGVGGNRLKINLPIKYTL